MNIESKKSVVHIVQLDRTKVKVLREINSVLIRISPNAKICQIIDVLVTAIHDFYGLILSRDW